MTERPKFFDDLAGVAGGAFSALAGIREEAESLVRTRVEEAIRRLDLVKREDLEAVQEMAANARSAQEAAEVRLAAVEARLSAMQSGAMQGGAAQGTSSDDDQSAAGASEVAPGTMPTGPAATNGGEGGPSDGGSSEVEPGTMPPGSGASGSTMPPGDKPGGAS